MAYTHVQSATGQGNSTSPSATMDSAPTQGNLLVATLTWASSTDTSTIAGTWAKIDFVGSTDGCQIFWKVAGTGESTSQAPCTITSDNWLLEIDEYTGFSGTISVEAHGANADNDATKTLTATVNPTDSIEILTFGAAFNNEQTTTTWSGQKVNGSTTGVTERCDLNRSLGTLALTTFDKYEASSASGNYTVEAVASETRNGGVLCAIFKATVITKALSATATGAASFVKQTRKNLSATGTGAASFVKQAMKILSASGTGAASFIKQVRKILSASGTGTASLTALASYLKTLTATATGAATISATRVLTWTLTATTTGTASLSKSVNKILSVTATGTASFIKFINKTLSVGATGTAVFVKIVNKTISTTATGTALIIKLVGKTLPATAIGTASLVKSVNKILSATVTGSASFIKLINKTLSASATGSALLGRTSELVLSAVAHGVATITRRIGRSRPSSLQHEYNQSVVRRIAEYRQIVGRKIREYRQKVDRDGD